MNCKTYLAAALFAVALLFPDTMKAMSLIDFGHMNDDDEATYVTFLVEGTAKILRSRGQTDLAQRAVALFQDPSKFGGVAQLAQNLKDINTLNNRNATNPNNRAPVFGVEDAMAITFKDAGIIVSADYLIAIGKDFRPVGPPRSHPAGQ